MVQTRKREDEIFRHIVMQLLTAYNASADDKIDADNFEQSYDHATDSMLQEQNCSAISMNIHTLRGMIDDNISINIEDEGVKDLFKDMATCINNPANCMQYAPANANDNDYDNSAMQGGKKSKRTRNSKNKNKNKNSKRANKKKKTIKSKSKRRPRIKFTTKSYNNNLSNK
jgi:hypothetical protein